MIDIHGLDQSYGSRAHVQDVQSLCNEIGHEFLELHQKLAEFKKLYPEEGSVLLEALRREACTYLQLKRALAKSRYEVPPGYRTRHEAIDDFTTLMDDVWELNSHLKIIVPCSPQLL